MYAMTKNSRRQAGHAVACDLVRVACRGASRLAAMRHGAAMRARVAEGFVGYLVTDEKPCDMTAAEMAACWPFGSPDWFEVDGCGRELTPPAAWEYMPRRATADCWYDFGFQRCAVLERGQVSVIEVPDQGEQYDAKMIVLWGAHCRSSAVVVRF